MAISIARRTEACLQFMRNEFDIDKTVKWVLGEYADDPAIVKAANKEKLAQNIFTMGGTGLNLEANIQAFRNAVMRIGDEKHRQALAQWEAQEREYKERIRREKETSDAVNADYRTQVSKNFLLQEALSEAKEKAATGEPVNA